eukprot:8592137-Heterocapsa_arctica.AAC.1
MYGTRKAASKCEDFYSNVLAKLGFTKKKNSPCTFYNKSRNLRCVVHADDFTTLGADDDLDFFENQLKYFFELKVRGRLGGGSRD